MDILPCVVLVVQSCLTLCDPIDYSPPGSSVHGILQESWSGLPFPSPGDLPNPRIEPRSPELQGESLPYMAKKKKIRCDLVKDPEVMRLWWIIQVVSM